MSILLTAAPLRCADAPAADTYDWGLVRAYFSGGVILSQQNQSFSKQDLFLGFDLEKIWRYDPAGRQPRWMVASFFDTRLTSIPVATAGMDGMVESRRSAMVQMGFYVPLLTTEWSAAESGHGALFVAPLAKFGLETAGQTASDATGNLFTSQGYGVRMGHFSGTGAAGVAPELISYLDCVLGSWGSVPGSRRWGFEGRLKIPHTPLMVGFDANVGKTDSDLRFLFGTRFDAGKLLEKLK